VKTIEIVGALGFEFTYSQFSAALLSAGGDDVTLVINSPGGRVTDAFAMISATRAYKAKYPNAKITTELRGMAASMAPVLAGSKSIDTRRAEDNATFMVHNPYMLTMGDYREMGSAAKILENYAMLYARSLADRNTAKKTEKEIRAMMDAETWLFGEGIKAAGFVDEIIPAGDGAEDEATAMALAKSERERCLALMKSKESKPDAQAVALCDAMLSSLPGASGVDNTQPKPPAGGQQEENVKSLMEFQAQGADALAEVNQLKADTAKQAVAAERERVKDLDDAAAKYGKVGAIAELIATAKTDGKAFAEIAPQVASLALAAADSVGQINTGDQSAAPEAPRTGWAVTK
jgi:ATP-dependent protease ClpP protease subunit